MKDVVIGLFGLWACVSALIALVPLAALWYLKGKR